MKKHFDMCDKYTSQPERELQTILPNFFKTRKVIAPYEIDLYSDEYKVGIEFNGSYWHSTIYQTMFYHQEKCLMAINNGIKLYHIFDYEWTNDDDKLIVLSHIKRLMGLCEIKLDAKNCTLLQPSNITCNVFLDKHTIKYNSEYEIALCLEYKGDIVCIASFFKREDKWFVKYTEHTCMDINMGLRTLVQEFCRLYKVKEVYIEVNLGKLIYKYEENGFKFIKLIEPKYTWGYANKIVTEEELKFLFKNQEINEEYLFSLGYFKVYNCGKLLYQFL